MGDTSATKHVSIVGWLWLSAAAVAAMAGRRMTDTADGTWRWAVWGLAGLTLVKVVLMLRLSSTSPWRLCGVLASVAMAAALGIVGIPREWLQVPDLAQVGGVLFPLVLMIVAVLAVLIGLAQWNKRRELEGPAQHSRLAVVLNALIAVVAWQVIRQPLWKDSLAGMMQLPKVYENRLALEEGVNQWTEAIRNGGVGDTVPKRSIAANPVGAFRQSESVSAVDPGLAAAAVRHEDRRTPAAVRTRARFLQEMGCHADAAAELEPLVRSLQGDDKDTRECLRSLVLSHQSAHARELAARLVVRSPTRELQRWLACLDAENGEVDKAMSALWQLARRRPFDPADAYMLGELANLAGRPGDALGAVAHLEGAGERTERTRSIAARARAALAVHASPRGNVLVAQ